MSAISIQFHALPEEILPILLTFSAQENAKVLAFRFQPFEVFRVTSPRLSDLLHDSTIRRLAFTLQPSKLPVFGMLEFLDSNPDVLIFDIGRLQLAGLTESWLTGQSINVEVLRAWRKAAKLVRSVTRTGVVAVNPNSGATVELKSHRFSEGAKKLELDGIPMLAVGGGSRLRFKE